LQRRQVHTGMTVVDLGWVCRLQADDLLSVTN
jgi:hypothetical protein